MSEDVMNNEKDNPCEQFERSDRRVRRRRADQSVAIRYTGDARLRFRSRTQHLNSPGVILERCRWP